MQKALDQMNLQIHHVISDITGLTGLRIIDANLAGQRDRKKLAELRDGRIKAPEKTIVKALIGDQREHLFYASTVTRRMGELPVTDRRM